MEMEDLEKAERDRQDRADLHRAVGSRCELRSNDNSLIFLGRIRQFDGKAITVYSATGKELPPVIFNTEFKIIIRVPGRSAQVWKGQIVGSATGFWKLDHLVRFTYAEHRSTFRQPISISAKVCRTSDPEARRKLMTYHEEMLEEEKRGAPLDCRVLDISLGGLQLRCRERYERGEWLEVTQLRLLPGNEPAFMLVGQVCWADRAGSAEFLFGLRFAPMRMREQDRLCSAIFALQRLDLQSQLQ